MKKTMLSIVAAGILLTPAMAEEVNNEGKVSAQLKAMHILSGEENGFDTNTGSAVLANVKYETSSWNNLSVTLNQYTLMETGLTDLSGDTGVKPALGMFINGPTSQGQEFSILAEAHLHYKTKTQDLKLGRQIWKTPLSTIKWSTMPTFHEGLSYTNEMVDGLKINASHITRMAYGARSMADSGLIGEKTNTAGAHAFIRTGAISQGTFINLADAAGISTNNSNGMSVLGTTFTGVKNLTVNVWDYYVSDITNMFYSDLDYTMPLSKTMKVITGVQYLNQAASTSDLLGTEIDYNLVGAKIGLAGKTGLGKYKLCVSYNQSSGNTAMFNVWGSDPAYTSTIFSRNAYRENVAAYKIGAMSGLGVEGLKLMVHYANYGQSDTTAVVKPATTAIGANTDATELDIVLVYEPNKEWMFKIFNAIRTSEYDGQTLSDASVVERTQNHIRMMATYSF